jgi:hypothetical protein
MEIDMTHTIEYPFDDIEVTVNGYTYTASGMLPVQYYVEPADSSVGIPYPYAEIDDCGPIDAELVDEDGNITKVVLQRESDAHNKIVMIVSKGCSLEEACMDDYHGI